MVRGGSLVRRRGWSVTLCNKLSTVLVVLTPEIVKTGYKRIGQYPVNLKASNALDRSLLERWILWSENFPLW
jgi:hypothetical protein